MYVRVVLYEEEKEQKSEETFSPEFSFALSKVRKLFPQSFPLLFLSLPETRERDAHEIETTHK